MKISIILFTIFLGLSTYGRGFDKNQFNISIGNISSSYAESESGITNNNTNPIPAKSGSASALALDISYENFTGPKWSYFFRGTVPLVASSSDRYFLGGAGINYYLKSLSSEASYADKSGDIFIQPKWRYFVGGSLGLGYLVYKTDTQKKSDVLAEIGAHGGTIYQLQQNLGIRVEIGYSRGVGVSTETGTLKLLLGITRYF